MVPGTCAVAAHAIGWFMAHAVIGIRNPHWVQHGEHPILDSLARVAMYTTLPGLISPLALLVLPWTLLTVWWSSASRARKCWQTILVAMLSLPAWVLLAMFVRPFGPPLGIVDWIPD
jgi:hypothetical protein